MTLNPATRASCGYITGLLLHRALGEDPCWLCMEAHEVRIANGEGKPMSPLPITRKMQQENRDRLASALAELDKYKRPDYRFPTA